MTDHEEFVKLSSVLTGLSEDELHVLVEHRDALGTAVKLYEIYLDVKTRLVIHAFPEQFRALLMPFLEGLNGRFMF
jgi:hypothetical protein